MWSLRTVCFRPGGPGAGQQLRHLVSNDVVNLVYNTYGADDASTRSKPPIVFVHGLLGHKGNVSSVCKAIYQRLRREVIAPDLRNHGHNSHVARAMSIENMAADVLALIEQLGRRTGDRSVSLIGHSMGGRIVGFLALKHPSMVKSVVLEDIALRKLNATNHFVWRCFEAMRKVAASVRDLKPVDVHRGLVVSRLNELLQDKAVSEFIATNAVLENHNSHEGGAPLRWLPNIDVIENNMTELFDFPSVSRKEVYPGPTLLIRGAHSSYVHDDDIPSMKMHFPKLVVHTEPDASHWVHADQPNRFIVRVCEFLSSPDV